MMADGDGGDDGYGDDEDAVEHDGDDGALPRQRLAQARSQGVPCPRNACSGEQRWQRGCLAQQRLFQASGDGDRDDDERSTMARITTAMAMTLFTLGCVRTARFAIQNIPNHAAGPSRVIARSTPCRCSLGVC